MSLNLRHDCVLLAKVSSPYCTEYGCGSFARRPCPAKDLGHFPRNLMQILGLMFTRISLGLIKVYQEHVRGWLPVSCRFTPTCSEYARQAIAKYGFWRGWSKGLIRLLSCHPFSGKSGFDPVD